MLLLLLIILLLSILLLFLLSIKISGLSGDNTGKIILTSIFNNHFQRKKNWFCNLNLFTRNFIYCTINTYTYKFDQSSDMVDDWVIKTMYATKRRRKNPKRLVDRIILFLEINNLLSLHLVCVLF